MSFLFFRFILTKSFIEFDVKNLDEIFFDRDYKDQFIFTCKKNIDIKTFQYFN